MIYLITRSEQYYPTSGTGDWIDVTDDEDHARAVFEQIVEHSREAEFIFLISISNEGWRMLDQAEGKRS